MKTTLSIIMVLLLPTLTQAAGGGTVRDGHGNLLETWSRKGERIQVRDKDNNLSRELRRQGERIEIRDGDGNLVGEMRKDK